MSLNPIQRREKEKKEGFWDTSAKVLGAASSLASTASSINSLTKTPEAPPAVDTSDIIDDDTDPFMRRFRQRGR